MAKGGEEVLARCRMGKGEGEEVRRAAPDQRGPYSDSIRYRPVGGRTNGTGGRHEEKRDALAMLP